MKAPAITEIQNGYFSADSNFWDIFHTCYARLWYVLYKFTVIYIVRRLGHTCMTIARDVRIYGRFGKWPVR